MRNVRHLGILGGSFDPIHYGHLRGAEEIREILGLDLLLFVPTGCSPHKGKSPIASPKQRLAMVDLAIVSNPACKVSDYEIEHKETLSHSIFTLEYLKSEYKSASFYLIVGSDVFVYFHHWKRYNDILDITNIAIMARPYYARTYVPTAIQAQKLNNPGQSVQKWLLPSGNTIYDYQITALNISSSQIRDSLKQKKSIRYLTTPDVCNYIYSNGLYLD